MRCLSRYDFVRLTAVAMLIGCAVAVNSVTTLRAADDKTRLTVQVMTDETKKPVASAHVVVRFVSGKKFFIKDKKTSWEAQTNRRGELVMDDIPAGRVKIQVIAKGY